MNCRYANRAQPHIELVLALAESLNAELWTLDGLLYRNAISYGFSVRLLQ